MNRPQQPELARSRRSAADPASAKSKVGGPTTEEGRAGPIPEDNLPGHHPEHDQDKPEAPPPRPRSRPARPPRPAEPPAPAPAPAPAAKRPVPATPNRRVFRFAFEPRMVPFAMAVGVTPATARVEVADGELRVRFGPWSLRTPVDNVEAAEVTGPYAFPRVVGPPRLSLADRGVTFATTTRRGVCVRFREPVAAALPFGLLRHPALTVTVDRPEELASVLEA